MHNDRPPEEWGLEFVAAKEVLFVWQFLDK
jgi:hypothetical protein